MRNDAPPAFAAPWDARLLILTVGLSVVLIGTSALAVWAALLEDRPTAARVVAAVSAAVPLVVLLATAFFAPRGYMLDRGSLRIERWIGAIEVPLETIQRAELLGHARLAGSLRTLGVDGLFGYYGLFRNRQLGQYRMYASRRSGAVLLSTSRGPVVITPAEPRRFLEELSRMRAPPLPGSGSAG